MTARLQWYPARRAINSRGFIVDTSRGAAKPSQQLLNYNLGGQQSARGPTFFPPYGFLRDRPLRFMAQFGANRSTPDDANAFETAVQCCLDNASGTSFQFMVRNCLEDSVEDCRNVRSIPSSSLASDVPTV